MQMQTQRDGLTVSQSTAGNDECRLMKVLASGALTSHLIPIAPTTPPIHTYEVPCTRGGGGSDRARVGDGSERRGSGGRQLVGEHPVLRRSGVHLR